MSTASQHVEASWTIPSICPSWCAGDHLQELAEGASMEVASHHRRFLQDVILDDLRNPVSHQVWREGGSSYDVCIEEGAGNYPLVEVMISESHDDGHDIKRAQIRLSTGEARVLAAKLQWAADRADLD